MRAALIAVRTVLLVPAVAVVLVNFYGPSSITDPEPVFEEKRVIFIALPPLFPTNCLKLVNMRERPAGYTLPLCPERQG